MVEQPVMAIATHDSHKMGITYDIHRKVNSEICTVCYECACHSPTALLSPCDDISWTFAQTTE